MTERQKVMGEVDRAMKKMTDLRDMLSEDLPASERRVILRKLNVLSDVIFYGQEYLSET